MTFTERREATKSKLRSLVDAWKSKYGYRPPKDALDFLANKYVTHKSRSEDAIHIKHLQLYYVYI